MSHLDPQDQPSSGTTGDEAFFLAPGLDASLREAVAQRMAQNDARERSIIDVVTDQAIFLTNARGDVVRWGKGAEKTFGYTEREILGRNSSILWVEEERERGPADERAAASADPGQIDNTRWFVHKSGRRFVARSALRAIRDAAGAVTGFVRTCRDETERLKTEQMLADVRSRLDVALEAGSIATWVYDPLRDKVFGDPNLQRFFGVSQADVNGGPISRFFRVVHPEDRDRVVATLQRAMAMLESYEAEYRISSGGVERWVVARGKVERDAAGKPLRLPGVVLDITQRKRAEQSLRESEQKYRNLFRSMDSGFCVIEMIFDETGRPIDYLFHEVNPAFERHTGMTNVTGRRIRELAPDVDEHWIQIYGQVALTGQPIQFENQARFLAGRWYNVYAFQLQDGSAPKVAIIFSNVSEQRAAVEALQRSEENFRTLAEAQPDAVWTADTSGRILWANSVLPNTTGVSLENIRQLGYPSLVHPDDAAATSLAWEQALRSGEPFEVHHRIRQRDGFYRWHLLRAAPARDARGAIDRWIGTSTDIHAQRELQSALQRSEARFRQLADAMPQIVWAAGPDGKLDYYNRRWFEYINASSEDAATARWDQYVHPEDLQRAGETWERSLRSGEPYAIEFRVRRADGEYRWFLVRALPIRDAHGSIVRWFGACTDIHDQKAVEAAMRLARDQMEIVVKGANVGVWYCPLPFDRLIWDEKVKEHFHLPPDAEVTIDTFYERLHPDDRESTRQAIERSILARAPYDIDYRTVSPDGQRVRWIRAIGRGFYDAAGNPTRFDGITIDITERLRVEQQVRQSEARLADILRTSLDCIVSIDHLGRVLEWNPAAESVFGYRREEVIGRDLAELILPASAMGLNRQALSLFVAAGIAPILGKRLELTAVCRDGRELPVELTVTSATAADPPIFTAFLRDITPRRRAEAEREALLESERAARSQAERASRMKDEFLATLSHELRTPLNAILGWSQIMQGGKCDADDLAQGLEVIERNARAQSQIIEDLLDMSRIISGKVRLDVQRLDLANVVRAAVETARPTAETKGVRLTAVIDPLPGIDVSGDANRLQQVLWNLLSNAIKFTPRGGRVQVVLSRVNSHLEISVSDSGVGISAEFLPFVFDRFRQADASTTRRFGGLGLGLSIVKQLVELHGGSVTVKSEGVGLGSTFIVTLPITVTHDRGELEMEHRHPRLVSRAAGMPDLCVEIHGVRVLVVDDEPDARALVKRLLEDCDAVVTTAASADEAFTLLRNQPFDVLISDIGMPGEDGYSLIKNVRSLGKTNGGDIPAIALTAYARAEDRVKAIAAGFQMHVAKPVEPVELVTMVASAAGRTGNGL